MKCQRCQSETRVLSTNDGKRRRVCKHCHHRFTTHEVTAEERARMAADSVRLARVRGVINEAPT